MIDLKKIHEDIQPDIEDVTAWCNEIYTEWFGDFFIDARSVFTRLKEKDRQITDAELTYILMSLPVQLFSVSEALQKFKISQQVVKLKNRQREKQLIETSIETTQTKRQRDAEDKQLEDRLLDTAYSTIIDRVSSEVSFCRELIMSAKKLWDARRYTDSVMPVSEVDPMAPKLPDYKPGNK